MALETVMTGLDRKIFAGFWIRVLAMIIDLLVISFVATLIAIAVNSAVGKIFTIDPILNFNFSFEEKEDPVPITNANDVQGILTVSVKKAYLFGFLPTKAQRTMTVEFPLGGNRSSVAEFHWPIEYDDVVDRELVLQKLMEFDVNWPADQTQKHLDELMYLAFGENINTKFAGMWSLELAIYILYFTLFEASSKRSTLGKLICRLRVLREDGGQVGYLAAFGRSVGRIGSVLILLIGLIMVAWTKHRQGLHDIMVKTIVVWKKDWDQAVSTSELTPLEESV